MPQASTEEANSRSKEKDIRRPAGLLPTLFNIFLSFIWGGNNVSIKVALDYSPPLQIGWMRFVFGGLVTLGYMMYRRESFRIYRNEAVPLCVIVLLFTVQIALMNFGQDKTTAGHATALNSTFPIWAAVIAHFIVPSDRLSRWKMLAIVFSYSGILAIVFGDSGFTGGSTEGVSISGDLMSLASAALLGLRLVLMSNFAQNMSEAKIMLAQLVMGTVFFLIGSYLVETPSYTLETRFWGALFYQGVIIAGFGFLSNAWLVKRYLPSTVTFFSFIQPPAGLVLAWLILGEDPGSGLIAGLFFIVAGAIIFGGESYIRARKVASLNSAI